MRDAAGLTVGAMPSCCFLPSTSCPALLSRLAPPIPISNIFSMGFFTNIPATMEAKGRRLLSIFSDFVLPVNNPTSTSGSIANT